MQLYPSLLEDSTKNGQKFKYVSYTTSAYLSGSEIQTYGILISETNKITTRLYTTLAEKCVHTNTSEFHLQMPNGPA